ncbi:MAG: primase [Frankiales bacterium]|nr:primase [Frankiales bacterium]
MPAEPLTWVERVRTRGINGVTAPPKATAPDPAEIRAAELAWHAAGFGVVMTKQDGSKRPDGDWKHLQSVRATAADITSWSDHRGFGLITGAVSGNAEMFEFEGRAVEQGLHLKVRALVPDELWTRFRRYLEVTPTGGFHIVVRVEGDPVPGNLKLARRPSTDEELQAFRLKEHIKADALPADKRARRLEQLINLTPEQVPQVLTETRGEGGFVVVAPSGGAVHPSGKPWTLKDSSKPGVVGTITSEERDLIVKAFASVDCLPKPKQAGPKREKGERATPRNTDPTDAFADSIRPGDDYAARTPWPDIVEPHGWTWAYRYQGADHWTRPGKVVRDGTSATTGYGDADLLYVFTSSVAEFEPETTYTKFGAYAALNHGGDFKAATRQLAAEGYGSPSKPTTPTAASKLVAAEEKAPEAEDGGWEPPIPLDTAPVPPFPVEALPPVLADWTAGTATATQTPPDLAGFLALDAVATAAAGKYRVKVKEGWSEPLNLYTLVSLPPGSRKSAVFSAATRPLQEAERLLIEQHAPTVRQAQQQQRILERAREKAERDAAAQVEDRSKLVDAVAAGDRLAQLVVPPMPRLLADDVTPEALVGLLADHTRLGLLSEEGGIFETLAGRYSGGVANIDAVLKAHDGGTILVDRKGSAPRQVRGAALVLGLAVQPAVLAAMSRVPEFTGRGLVARFVYALPPTHGLIGRRDTNAPPVDVAVAERYDARVQVLALAPLPTTPVLLTLSPGAVRLFQEFQDGLEPRRNADTGDLADLVEWSGKLEGLTARLAGLLHVGRHGEGCPAVIAEQDMAGAIRLAEYAIPHARAALDLMSGRNINGPALSLLRVIRDKGLDVFAVRELHKLVEGQVVFHKVDGVQLALAVLLEAGYIRPVPDPASDEPKRKGRPPSPRYTVNPLWSAGPVASRRAGS